MMSLRFWRLALWFLMFGAALLVAIHLGLVPAEPFKQMLGWLASQTAARDAGLDPGGPVEARVLLVSVLSLATLAGVVGLVVLACAWIAATGTFGHVAQAIGLPHWAFQTVLFGGLSALLYTKSDVWLPASLSAVGALAHTWLVALQ